MSHIRKVYSICHSIEHLKFNRLKIIYIYIQRKLQQLASNINQFLPYRSCDRKLQAV